MLNDLCLQCCPQIGLWRPLLLPESRFYCGLGAASHKSSDKTSLETICINKLGKKPKLLPLRPALLHAEIVSFFVGKLYLLGHAIVVAFYYSYLLLLKGIASFSPQSSSSAWWRLWAFHFLMGIVGKLFPKLQKEVLKERRRRLLSKLEPYFFRVLCFSFCWSGGHTLLHQDS